MAHTTQSQPTQWIETAEPRSGNAPRTSHGAARRWAFRIGRVFGIDLYVHATFLLLLAWVGFSHLAQGRGLRAAFDALALLLAVFGVVVLHELGHALVAKRFGIRTRDITLLPIGGVASLERLPEKPAQELLVAIAGPAVNIVLAGGLAGVIALTGGALDVGSLNVVGGPFLPKLMWINVSLALFNLLPAFPMDGGRVLRALLAFRMERARATEVAARIGQGMAVLFAIVGFFGNAMLVLIAVFVWIGAQQESSLAQVKAALRGVPVRSAMITELRTLAPEEPLARAVELILAGFQHDFPVLSGGLLVGVLTRNDVVRGLAEGGPSVLVEQVMRRDYATAEPTEMLESALARLNEPEAPSIVVQKDGHVLGMLTMENIGELIVMETALRKAGATRRRRG